MLKFLSSLVLVLCILLQVQIHGYVQPFQRYAINQYKSNRSPMKSKQVSLALSEGEPEKDPKQVLREIGGQKVYEKKSGTDAFNQFFSYRNFQLQSRNANLSYVPLYRPGSYPRRALAALTYLIPLIDASDLGKYMFEAYPEIGSLYNSVLAPFIAVYNGVPFLPFAVFFAMAYVARGPQFPTEIRFHISQAFVLSLLQFVPSLVFPFMERAQVPGIAVWYNTMFLFVVLCSLNMQTLLLLPFGNAKNPVILNTLGLTLNLMNRPTDPFLKAVKPEEPPRDDKL